MSLYQFLPNKPREKSTTNFVTWADAFSTDEINRIVEIGNSLPITNASVGMGEHSAIDTDIRRTKISWIENMESTGWIYDRLAYIARSINSDFYRFDLYGFIEHIQYTVYTEEDSGFYDWHLDYGSRTECTRKLSLVVQLSDPEDYEGGELEIMTSKDPVTVNKQAGMAVAFPSYTLHRVNPVTKGIRRTLVVWIGGPDFK